MIYVAEAVHLCALKIGYARHPQSRVESLQTGCPTDLRIILTIPGDRELERHFHERFADCRIRGEWFSPSPDMDQWLAACGMRLEWFSQFYGISEEKYLEYQKDYKKCVKPT